MHWQLVPSSLLTDGQPEPDRESWPTQQLTEPYLQWTREESSEEACVTLYSLVTEGKLDFRIRKYSVKCCFAPDKIQRSSLFVWLMNRFMSNLTCSLMLAITRSKYHIFRINFATDAWILQKKFQNYKSATFCINNILIGG